MLQLAIILLLSSFLLTQCAQTSSDNQLSPSEDSEAYEVYSAILPSEWPIRVAKAKMLVIGLETKSYEMCLRPEKEFEEVMGGAISEYVRLNEKTWPLQRLFNIEMPYKLVAADELNATLTQGGWEGFYKQYPDSGGWIELSAVGFNSDKTVAVAYMGHHCGNLCGGGGFHVLEKKDGKWIPLKWKGSSCAWAS